MKKFTEEQKRTGLPLPKRSDFLQCVVRLTALANWFGWPRGTSELSDMILSFCLFKKTDV